MTLEEIAEIPDVTEGLENLIKNAASSCNTIDLMYIHLLRKYLFLTWILKAYC